ncbi:MAG: ATP-binding protein [Proteobacteria bacterium]|nr:ATP-binding protein [Pseudomonadota bacterium]
MAESLQSLLSQTLTDSATRDDTLSALKVIAERTGGLSRFLAQYSRLARLPAPRPQWQSVSSILKRVVALEPLQYVEIGAPAGLEAFVDSDQLEQALINLAKNAVEASISHNSAVEISAQPQGSDLVILVTDQGQGITNPDNLFVPFFTTKPGGSGVGLVLSRQIAEAHGGTLSLENRTACPGAIATLRIPGVIRQGCATA